MKKIKILLSMLTAVLFLSRGFSVEAATVTLDSGTKQTTVTMTLKDLQSFEGELRVKKMPKDAEMTIDSVTAKIAGQGQGICDVSADNKIFMVGMGEPVTTTIKIKVTFTKDGTYVLELDGGRTDKNGEYKDFSDNSDSKNKDKYLEQVKIVVGKSSSNSSNSSESTNNNTSSTNSNTSTNSTANNNTSSSQTTKTNKNSGSVDYSSLEQALKNADQTINSSEELKGWQTLFNNINNGAMLLNSENQEQIDQAAVQIQEQLMNLKGDLDSEQDKSDLANFWKFLLVAILIFTVAVFIATLIYFRRKSINTVPDYEGAPMVEYYIEEDDE